jgi:hypothetical protein
VVGIEEEAVFCPKHCAPRNDRTRLRHRFVLRRPELAGKVQRPLSLQGLQRPKRTTRCIFPSSGLPGVYTVPTASRLRP